MVKKPGDSYFWTNLMDVEDLVLKHGKFKVNSSNETNFWDDLWIGQEPLKVKFPTLNISFRRALVSEKLDDWLNLVSLVVPINLNGNKDMFLWRMRKNGEFFTQSLYRETIKKEMNGGKYLFGKAKLPIKNKDFPLVFKSGHTYKR